MIDTEEFLENYIELFQDIVVDIKTNKALSIPYVIMTISTEIVPSMAHDLGKIKNMTGLQKKTLIIESIEYAVDQLFEQLNQMPEFEDEIWDDTLKEVLSVLIGPMLDNLIAVEKGQLTFNKRFSSIFKCCK